MLAAPKTHCHGPNSRDVTIKRNSPAKIRIARSRLLSLITNMISLLPAQLSRCPIRSTALHSHTHHSRPGHGSEERSANLARKNLHRRRAAPGADRRLVVTLLRYVDGRFSDRKSTRL